MEIMDVYFVKWGEAGLTSGLHTSSVSLAGSSRFVV